MRRTLSTAGVFILAFIVTSAAGSPPAQSTTPYTGADLAEGAAAFMNSCAACHGPDGDGIPGAELNRPTLRQARTDSDIERIILNGIPGTAMPPATLNRRQVDTIIGYVRSLSEPSGTAPGNAANGRAIFAASGCETCHRVNGRGSRTGPDLSDIGIRRRAADIRESLVDPNAEIRPENRFVTIVTDDGGAIRGRILNHNTRSVEVVGPDGRPWSFQRDSVRSIRGEPLSPMPSVRSVLTEPEITDLVAWLVSLRGLR